MEKVVKQVIFILGGALINDAGIWRTTNYDEGDNFGVSGDRLRVIAAAYLYRENKNSFFIVLGGRGQLKNISGSPAVAKVIKSELINLAVPARGISIETKSGNTYGQLKALKSIIKKNKIRQAAIISNRYHFKRIKAMLALAPDVKSLERVAKIKLISAEAVVLKYGEKKWKKIIDLAYWSRAMSERIKLEETGVKQIKQGKYIWK
ncbi:MAG: YdcF family protein [bacterium]|nr:YdcF family protein [bacterium]